MQKPERILISINKSILDALVMIEREQTKALICVDDENRLRGLVVDGDIRRGLIAGKKIDSPVSSIMNPTPIIANTQMKEQECLSLVSEKVKILPVIDAAQKVVGYYSYKQEDETKEIRNRKITILGMGYVGLTLGTVLADKGFHVTGLEINESLVSDLKKKQPHFYEEGLSEYMDRYANKTLKFTSNPEEAKGDIYIVTVGTPLLPGSKTPNINHVTQGLQTVGKILQKGDLVILRSTVPVGCCRDIAIPALEQESGLTVGKDFKLAFAPERTAEGVALKELLTNPQIVGGFDKRSFELCSKLFHTITSTVIEVDSLEAAELCKLIDNTFRDHLFSYSNHLARLTEKLGLDLHDLINAVNFGYKRNIVPKPSPGVGGPCLSKDPYILKTVFDKFSLDTSLILEARKANERGPALLKEKLARLLEQAGKDIRTAKITLIGMAFKGYPETSDLRDSTSVWFLDELPKTNKNIYAYDPVVSDEDLKDLGLIPVSLEDAFKNTDAVVVLNNHKSYLKWNLSRLFETMNKPSVFIDSWHMFNPKIIKKDKGILYGGIGNE